MPEVTPEQFTPVCVALVASEYVPTQLNPPAGCDAMSVLHDESEYPDDAPVHALFVVLIHADVVMAEETQHFSSGW